MQRSVAGGQCGEARGILWGRAAGAHSCEDGRKEVSGGKVAVCRAGKAAALTPEGHGAGRGNAERTALDWVCLHSYHIRSMHGAHQERTGGSSVGARS